jgi:hypothetical protein
MQFLDEGNKSRALGTIGHDLIVIAYDSRTLQERLDRVRTVRVAVEADP